jgi:hypothetical protein
MPSPLVSLAVLEVAEVEERPRRLRIGLPGAVLIVAALYFVWVALLAMRVLRLNFLEPFWTVDDWARSGAILFVVLLLALVAQAAMARRQGSDAAPAWHAAPVARVRAPDEIVMTGETVQGARVLEYSRPPKSEHAQAVYAKCLVPVQPGYVLRVEDLVADAKD